MAERPTLPAIEIEELSSPTHDGAGSLEAYYARPEGDGPFPGLVVIHELFGLNGNIRDIARRLAREGYAALAVDLFSTGPRSLCMLRLIYGMTLRPLRNGTVRELRHQLDLLGSWAEVDQARLGAIGFCMGGTYALQLACVDDDLRAASIFYGMNPRPLDAVARSCPVVASYPVRDFTASGGHRLDEQLDEYGVDHDIKFYPGTRHSFFNDRAPNFDPEAAADAWRRTLTFFDRHLRAP